MQSKSFLGLSSSESDVAKLLNDSNVNQLNFPSNSKTYEFNINNLQDEKNICTNNNASVEQFLFRPLNNFPLAAKILHIPRIRNQIDETQLKSLIEEVSILRKISHGTNVIDFYGYALDGKKVWIFMELMEASLEDLYQYFHEKIYEEHKFSRGIVIVENVVGVIAVCILDALVFCKKQGVMHRDVKPRNVLVNKEGEVKLCDFGHSKILESGSKASTFKGTLLYLPPERFEDVQPYDDRTDIWSLGITLVEIAYGDIPHNVKGLRPNEDYAKIMNIIKNANGDEIMSRCFNEDYSDDLRYFVKSCLNELSLRPKYQELIETNLYKSFVAKDDNKKNMKNFIEIYSESLKIENNLRKYNEAIADYTKAIELNPTNANAYNSRGVVQNNFGKYNEAIADYTKAIELNPTFAIAYNNRGGAQNNLGKYNEAIADYTKAIELNPTNANAYNRRGAVQNNLGKYREAIADYTKAIKLNPTDAIVYNNRGAVQNNLGKYNEAIANCTIAIELNPTYENAYNNRGLAQNWLGKYNEAIADFTKAIELNPTFGSAYGNRGLAQKNFGKYNEAIADCTKAIELNPAHAYAYNHRGAAQNNLGKYNEAIADCTKAIELNPAYVHAYYRRGNTQLELGQFSDAIIDYTKFMSLNPYDNRGVSKDQLDQCDNKAKPTYQFSIEWNSLYALAVVYNNSGVSIEKSMKYNIDFPEDFELNPSNTFAYNNRGAAHVKLGLYEKAIADFTEAIELKSSCALLYNNRGTAQAELGKYDEANADYIKAIELKPKFDLAINNQKMLMDKMNFGK